MEKWLQTDALKNHQINIKRCRSERGFSLVLWKVYFTIKTCVETVHLFSLPTMPCCPCRSWRCRFRSSLCFARWVRSCSTPTSWSWRSLRSVVSGNEPSAPRSTGGLPPTWTTSSHSWTGWRSACSVQSQTWRTSEEPWQRSERSAEFIYLLIN